VSRKKKQNQKAPTHVETSIEETPTSPHENEEAKTQKQ
jgi:hypothetical protein